MFSEVALTSTGTWGVMGANCGEGVGVFYINDVKSYNNCTRNCPL